MIDMKTFEEEIIVQKTIKRKYLYLIMGIFIIFLWWINDIGLLEAFFEGYHGPS